MNRRRRIVIIAGAVTVLAAGLVLAQPSPTDQGADNAASSAGPPGVPIIEVPSDNDNGPPANSAKRPRAAAANAASNAAGNSLAAAPPPPPPALVPVRSPAAIIQAIDKVTLETMRFAVPVNGHVRYKNLVFQVKACESTGLGSASPQASAYVVVDSAPLPSPGYVPPAPREVFKGWMFANSPGLNPLQHPVYDA